MLASAAPHIAHATAVYASLSNLWQDHRHPAFWIRVAPSTLFDASLLTPEPPLGGSFFMSAPQWHAMCVARDVQRHPRAFIRDANEATC